MRPSIGQLTLAFLLVTRIASAQQTAPLPPFNQPVTCSDGLKYIVESCQPWGPEERCVFRSERNGEIVNHANTWRSMLSEKLKDCKAAGTQAQPSRPNPGAPTTGAQNMDSSYLSKLPSVERVMREVQGKDPIDTAAKQAGAFWQLRNIIIHMAQNMRRNENNLTPDEQRIGNEYYAAWSKLWQTVTQQVKDGPTQFKLSGYTMDGAFLEEILQRLCAPGFRNEYWQMSEPLNSRIRQRLEQDKAIARQAEADRENAAKQQQPRPWQRELSRCIASGRSESQCMTEALSKGANDLFGMKKSPRPAGLYLTGLYRGAGGFDIQFGADSASIGCKQVRNVAGYGIEMNGNQAAIKILSRSSWDGLPALPGLAKPEPITEDFQGQRIVLPVRPDGRLAPTRVSPQPPGTVKVSGQVIVGYETGTRTITETDRNGYTTTRYEPIQRPITEPRTEQCTMGLLTLDPSVPGSGPSEGGLVTTALGAFLSVGDPKANKPIPPGFRVHGKYTGEDGFDIEFHPENALIGCRDAAIARDYSVSISGNRALVNIQHGATPITLELRPDGTMAASGQIQVNSRRVVGVKQRIEGTRNVQEPVFEPITDTCTLGVLSPPEGARASAASSTGTAAAPAPTRPPGSPTATRPSVPAGPGGTGTLSLSGGLAPEPGDDPPLAGVSFIVAKESLESVLRKAGLQPSPGGSAIKLWLTACETKQQLCQQGMSRLTAVEVGRVKFDAKGKAQLPALPPGTYYLVGSIMYDDRPMVWDLKIDLKPGPNSVILDQRNAAPID